MKPYFDENNITLYHGDNRVVLPKLADGKVDCVVTSPPYWGLRDYGCDGQIGLEQTPEAYIAEMVGVFRGVWRVLKDEGTLWLNLGDSYAANRGGTSIPAETLAGGVSGRGDKVAERGRESGGRTPHRDPASHGLKHKDLIGIPWRVALALQADGWYLRQDIIWAKPNPMPESVTDRCTKAHEYIFLLTKSERYHFDAEAIAEPMKYAGITGMDASGFKDAGNFNGKHKMRPVYVAPAGHVPGGQNQTGRKNGGKDVECDGNRNKRSVWNVPTFAYAAAHFATFPPALITPCIKAGVPAGGTVLDPFFGAGTTGLVAQRQHVNCIGIELNEKYCEIAAQRLAQGVLTFTDSAIARATAGPRGAEGAKQ